MKYRPYYKVTNQICDICQHQKEHIVKLKVNRVTKMNICSQCLIEMLTVAKKKKI